MSSQLTLFAEETLASHSVFPGSEEAKKMTVTSGRKLYDYFKKSDRIGLLVKMLLGMSRWGSMQCSLTWKASVTPHRRLLFQLRPSEPRTEETW